MTKRAKHGRALGLTVAVGSALAASAGCGGGGGAVFVVEAAVTAPSMWSGTYEIRQSIDVRSALTLAPCTRLLLGPDVVLSVRDGGSLRALGTAECPVRIESASAAPAAGDWNRIDIYSSSSNDNLFRHTQITHGNGAGYGAVWVEGRATAGFENVTFAQIREVSVKFEAEARCTSFSNVRFEATNAQLAVVPPGVAAVMTGVTAPAVPGARVVLDGTETRAAMTWRALGVPYELPSMAVTGGALEVEAGAVLRMAPDAVLAVRDRGALRLLGTAASPVTVESAKGAPAPGDWKRIEFYGTSERTNLLRNAVVQHAGDSSYGVLWVEAGATVALEAATLRNNSSCDVGGEPMNLTATGSTFVPCAME